MFRVITGFLFLMASLLCSQALADHIQYFDYADLTQTDPIISSGESWTWTFDLTQDLMTLVDIDSGSSLPDGSYDPAYDLHYVTLRIDPSNINLDGNPGCEATNCYLQLTVNGIEISDWSNPIRLYDWESLMIRFLMTIISRSIITK